MPLVSGKAVGVFVTNTDEVKVVELNVVNVVEGEETVTGKEVVIVVSASVDDGELEPPWLSVDDGFVVTDSGGAGVKLVIDCEELEGSDVTDCELDDC
jgi:hypothetical protein